jgi:hypothetical protein
LILGIGLVTAAEIQIDAGKNIYPHRYFTEHFVDVFINNHLRAIMTEKPQSFDLIAQE